MHRPPPSPLSARLRAGTRTLHAEAERAGVMRDLLRGQLAQHDYVALLQNLHGLYAALETALCTGRADPRLAPVCRSALFRQQAIERDLLALGAPVSGTPTTLVPAMHVYVNRLEALSAARSPRLVAHAYVRYLGDLHGGQVLARVVSRSLPRLSSSGGSGLDFYRFGPEDAVASHIDAFRRALDALPLSPAEADAVIDEACWGFGQHVQVFEELARPVGLSPCQHGP